MEVEEGERLEWLEVEELKEDSGMEVEEVEGMEVKEVDLDGRTVEGIESEMENE